MEEPTPVIVVEPKVKKPLSEAKRKQLEGAREKKAVQKKVVDSDSSEDEPEPAKTNLNQRKKSRKSSPKTTQETIWNNGVQLPSERLH